MSHPQTSFSKKLLTHIYLWWFIFSATKVKFPVIFLVSNNFLILISGSWDHKLCKHSTYFLFWLNRDLAQLCSGKLGKYKYSLSCIIQYLLMWTMTVLGIWAAGILRLSEPFWQHGTKSSHASGCFILNTTYIEI